MSEKEIYLLSSKYQFLHDQLPHLEKIANLQKDALQRTELEVDMIKRELMSIETLLKDQESEDAE